MRLILTVLQVALVPAIAVRVAPCVAGPYDPPPTYYSSATGSGVTLKSQLHNIIDAHTVFSYSATRNILKVTDRDPSNPSRILLVYDRVSQTASNHSAWNREHTWPRSRGVDSSGPDNSDLHQLRPSTISVNSDRGHLNFGGAFGAQGYGTVSDGGLKWYPGDADAGMIARQQFYTATRYDNSDSATDDLELVAGNPGINGTTMGDLNRLIEWHFAAPPDEFELRRNDVIYDSYQRNRNPYVDRPEFVWSVFVDQQNDSQIAIAGTTPQGNGGSTAHVDLGRVFVGAPTPSNQPITLDKTGNDGTYYRVMTSGLGTSNKVDSYNAFRTGGVDTASLSVGLDTDTSSAGQLVGSVTIDNLDITTDGGAGRGANDADDVIDITLDVIDHANPSFASDIDLDVLTHDFGTVTLGEVAPTWTFDLFNLEATTDFTAALELDEIFASGDSATLTTDLSAFAGDDALEVDANREFTAMLDTSVAGDFLTTFTLSFSDEDLPGAANLEQLQLTLVGSVEPAGEAADFDSDLDIDGGDYLTWQQGFMQGTGQDQGDANADMIVDDLDLTIWRQQYATQSALLTSEIVPEPTTITSVVVSLVFWSPCTSRIRSCR